MNNLTKNDLRILDQMKAVARFKGEFNSGTILTIAKNLEISERTAYRSINRLTKAGKLTTKIVYKVS